MNDKPLTVNQNPICFKVLKHLKQQYNTSDSSQKAIK